MKLTGKKYETEMRRLQHEEQILIEDIAELVEKRNKMRHVKNLIKGLMVCLKRYLLIANQLIK